MEARSAEIDSKIPVGLPQVSELMFSRDGAVPMAGQASSVTFSVTNPYSASIPDVGVGLSMDGKPVETKSLGTVLPKQTRSLMFTGIKLDKAGEHNVEVALTGGAKGGLKGTASAKVSVAPGLSSRSPMLSRPVALSTLTAPVAATGSVRPLATAATRSVLPPSFSIAGRSVGIRPVAAGIGKTGAAGATTLVLLPKGMGTGLTGIGTTTRPTTGITRITAPVTGTTTIPAATTRRPPDHRQRADDPRHYEADSNRDHCCSHRDRRRNHADDYTTDRHDSGDYRGYARCDPSHRHHNGNRHGSRNHRRNQQAHTGHP